MSATEAANTNKESVGTTAPVAPVSDEKPSDAVLKEVLAAELKDQEGKPHTLGALLAADAADTPRTVVAFIRHFYCSFCQEYVRALSSELSPSKLSALTPATRLIIVGHGDPSLIQKYAGETGSAFPIYADPSRAVFEKLGFVQNLSGVISTHSPGYIRRSRLSLALSTVRQFAFGGSKMLKSGKTDQNGGELVFAKGGEELVFIHRMRTTNDHVEPRDLENLLSA